MNRTVRARPAIIDTIILTCLFITFLSVSYIRYYNYPNIVLTSDTKGYYMYLPAIFVYPGIHQVPEPFMGQRMNEKGERYSKFTCGVAYCYLPFFLAAHAFANLFQHDPNGFSPPYCYAIIMAGICWAVFGLYLLKKLLLRYFSRGVTWATILCIVFGTNFYCYATLFIGMSHAYSFALFAAAALVMDNYYASPSKGKAILLAILISWVILIRPTNVPIVIFLFLYKVVSLADVKERVQFFKAHLSHLFIALPFFIAVLFPQMLYWKEMTGHWIKYSYQDERFIYWLQPKISSVLFDVQNGWLLYSPIMLFLFWAFFQKRKDARTNFWGTSITLAVITYIFASWWAWTFRDAFGHRCYIDYYPLLAFPFAVTMERIMNLRNYNLKILFALIIVFFCYYSVSMSNLYVSQGMGVWTLPQWRWNYSLWWGVVRQIFIPQ